MPMHNIMTKCHIALFLVTTAILSSCGGKSGQSLSEYGVQNDEYRNMMFENYVLELFSQTPERAVVMQDSAMRSVASDSAAFFRMLQLQNHFIYDVNSPYRCEDFYIPVAEAVVSSPFTSDSAKFAAREDIAGFSRNRLGTPAADFSFTLKGGRPQNLYSVKAELTLLFFSNPGCTNCKEIMEELTSTAGIDELIADGSLAVVNIYPDDDINSWYEYLASYPKTWINGYSPEVDDPDGAYLLRAIPTLYLLDRDKNVLLKDAPLERIIRILRK